MSIGNWISLGGLVITCVVGVLTWRIKGEMAEMEIRMRDWIDKGFIRRTEALPRIHGIEDRVKRLEDRPSNRALRAN